MYKSIHKKLVLIFTRHRFLFFLKSFLIINLQLKNVLREIILYCNIIYTSSVFIIVNPYMKEGDEYSTVIELIIIKRYSLSEAAKIMGKQESTISVLQHRALHSLSKILKENNLIKGE
jgi:hypothetical protein